MATADISDELAAACQIAQPVFRDYGGNVAFEGRVSTVKCFEDNSVVRQALEKKAEGRVLVVDGGASTQCALLGDMLAALAVTNGWVGVIVNGCIRDSQAIAGIQLGVKALATHPGKSEKHGVGERDIELRFAGVEFVVGDYLYADADGIVLSKKPVG